MTERVTIPESGKWDSLLSYLIYLRHLKVYQYVDSLVQDRAVLDIGCGTGYGTALLAGQTRRIVGVDISRAGLGVLSPGHADILFLAGDAQFLPMSSQSFDVVISFQVIEHIQNDHKFLAEIKRVLVPGGVLILSTPNKLVRLLPLQSPFNPYHIREYTPWTLNNLLRQFFSEITVAGLQANQEIITLEKQRLKQNPVQVYAKILRGYIPIRSAIGLYRLKKLMGRHHQTNTDHQETEFWGDGDFDEFSVDDYWIDYDQVDDALDLIGICRK